MEEEKGDAHGAGEPRWGLGTARGFPWEVRLHGGFSLGWRLVSFRRGQIFCGQRGRVCTVAWGRGLWEGWRYYKDRVECVRDFCVEWVCPVDGIAWLRVVPEPFVHAIEGVFEGGPPLH